MNAVRKLAWIVVLVVCAVSLAAYEKVLMTVGAVKLIEERLQ